MQYREVAPCAALRPYIRCYWTLAGRMEAVPAAQRVFPDGSMEMVFHFAEPFRHEGRRQARMLLAGQVWGPVVLEPSRECDVLGIRFEAGGCAAFLKFPQQEVAGRIVSLEDVWAGTARRLHERLGNERDRVEALERMLLALRPESAMPSRGLSARQYRRRFEAAVGIPPKLFARIARFQRSLQVMGRLPQADVALACGYYDQAHLIRDWREFAGVTPAGWLRDQSNVLFFQDGAEAEGVG
ncbi:MAG: AraC family transcriptional regulator [Bryobacterales bacterium]|nr:AraC family transcriptional regulator [Bryobacterales bacterium]